MPRRHCGAMCLVMRHVEAVERLLSLRQVHVVAFLTCHLTACSYAFVTPPPPGPPSGYQPTGACTRSPLAPGIDLTLTALGVAGAVVFLVARDLPDEGDRTFNNFSAVFFLTTSSPFAASSVYGLSATAECRGRYNQKRRRRASQRVRPKALHPFH